MYYDALSKNTLKIILTEQDMRTYSIKSECISRRNAETKRTLTRFLKQLRSENHIFGDLSTDRLFLEAFPIKEGGCVMYVSALGTEKDISYDNTRSIYGTEQTLMCILPLNDMIKLCSCICKFTEDSALYRMPEGYCLIVCVKKDKIPSVTHIMNEFGGSGSDRVDIAFVKEHGEALYTGDAAKKLSELL